MHYMLHFWTSQMLRCIKRNEMSDTRHKRHTVSVLCFIICSELLFSHVDRQRRLGRPKFYGGNIRGHSNKNGAQNMLYASEASRIFLPSPTRDIQGTLVANEVNKNLSSKLNLLGQEKAVCGAVASHVSLPSYVPWAMNASLWLLNVQESEVTEVSQVPLERPGQWARQVLLVLAGNQDQQVSKPSFLPVILACRPSREPDSGRLNTHNTLNAASICARIFINWIPPATCVEWMRWISSAYSRQNNEFISPLYSLLLWLSLSHLSQCLTESHTDKFR